MRLTKHIIKLRLIIATSSLTNSRSQEMDEGYRIHVRFRPWRALAVFVDGPYSAFCHHHVYHDDGQLRIPNLQPNLPLPALGYYDRVSNLQECFSLFAPARCASASSLSTSFTSAQRHTVRDIQNI